MATTRTIAHGQNEPVSFDDGSLIFREGERGDSAYRLLEGEVALLKKTDAGLIVIERVRPGSLFGETGVLEQSRRAVSAQAVGAVRVNVIARDAFLEEIKRDPEQALSVMSKIAAQSEITKKPNKPTTSPLGDTVLAAWLNKFLKPKPKPVPLVEVRIPGFAGEGGDAMARKLMASLEGFGELKVRAVPLPKTFPTTGLDDGNVSKWVGEARRLLLNNGGDVLVWGRVGAAGAATRVRLVSALPGDEEQAGNLTGFAELPLPAEIDEPFTNLLKCAVLSATAPQAGIKMPVVQAGLTGGIDAVVTLAAKPPRELTPTDKLNLTLSAGHIVATSVQRGAAPMEAMRQALDFYNRGLQMMPAESSGLARGLTMKNIASALMYLGDREDDPDRASLALETMQAACETIPRSIAPREWAAAHNKLGQMLYRMELNEADAEMTHLKQALSAFRAATQVYTRVDAPERWADVMNNYAQAAQVLGGNLQNPKVLTNSIQACRSALEVRRRDTAPIAWAATQNTLGIGLFLLGKITRNLETLHASAQAFEAARAVYQQSSGERMSPVISRNLGHVHALIEDIEETAALNAINGDPLSREAVDDAWWKANVVDSDDDLKRAVG